MTADPRIAFAFVAGLPPIWVWTIRYYEGIPDTRMGFVKAVTDTVCLFLLALFVAWIATAALNPQLLKGVDVQNLGNYF